MPNTEPEEEIKNYQLKITEYKESIKSEINKLWHTAPKEYDVREEKLSIAEEK
ncbi:MAG: hypothetical protein WAU24_10075 [Chitinophagaceae bacterium]